MQTKANAKFRPAKTIEKSRNFKILNESPNVSKYASFGEAKTMLKC